MVCIFLLNEQQKKEFDGKFQEESTKEMPKNFHSPATLLGTSVSTSLMKIYLKKKKSMNKSITCQQLSAFSHIDLVNVTC